MKLHTVDNRTLYLRRIGTPDADGCDKLYCKDERGNSVVITWGEVLRCFGSFAFPTMTKNYNDEKN